MQRNSIHYIGAGVLGVQEVGIGSLNKKFYQVLLKYYQGLTNMVNSKLTRVWLPLLVAPRWRSLSLNIMALPAFPLKSSRFSSSSQTSITGLLIPFLNSLW